MFSGGGSCTGPGPGTGTGRSTRCCDGDDCCECFRGRDREDCSRGAGPDGVTAMGD